MKQINESLNRYLANLVVLHRKLQNFHWYVTGPQFLTLHEKLEEYYDQVTEDIDTVAEEILKLEGKPLATLASYMETAQLKEATNDFITADEVKKHVIDDFTWMKKEIITIKKEADDQDIYEVSAMADEFIAGYSKAIWMLKQSSK